MYRFLEVVCLTASVAAALAQLPAAELAKPPAAARHFVIQSTGGKHGDSWSWVAADGTRIGRESMNLRGQVFELDSSGRAGADGMLSALTIRGVTPQGDAAETRSTHEEPACTIRSCFVRLRALRVFAVRVPSLGAVS
jgi:hypothetical protein